MIWLADLAEMNKMEWCSQRMVAERLEGWVRTYLRRPSLCRVSRQWHSLFVQSNINGIVSNWRSPRGRTKNRRILERVPGQRLYNNIVTQARNGGMAFELRKSDGGNARRCLVTRPGSPSKETTWLSLWDMVRIAVLAFAGLKVPTRK